MSLNYYKFFNPDGTMNYAKAPPTSIIQVVTETQNFQQVISDTYSDINKSSGVVWEIPIIPKAVGSKIFCIFKMSTTTNATIVGFRILCKTNSGGTYGIVYRPDESNASSPFNPNDFGSENSVERSQHIIPVLFTPTYSLGDTLFIKIQGASGSATINSTRTGNNGHSEVFIQEIKG